MSFLNPLGLLGLLAIPIIIIIYILRSKYKTKNVSSTFIWKRSLKFVKRRIPLNFIMSLLLILQILTVVAASFAIARPTVKPLKSEEKVVIIDASASMLAESGGQTRFEYAKQLVEEASASIGSNNQITLILAGKEATTLATRETDKGKLLTALRDVTCTMGDADINGAIELASKIIEQNSGATVQLYTDKSYINTENIEIVDCKRSGEWNAGIISFEDNDLVTGTEFIANVGNYGLNSSCSVKLLIDGKVVGQKIVELEPNEILQIKFSHLSSSDSTVAGELRVKLTEAVKSYQSATITINSEDNFGYDDSMTLYPREKINPKIMYVSTYVVNEGGKKSCPTSFLYRALMATGYIIDTSNMYSDVDEVDAFKGYDLYIFEGVEPYDIPTDGAVWILNAKRLPETTGIIIDNEERNSSATGNKEGYKFTKSLTPIEEIVKNVTLSPLKLNVGGTPVYVDAAVTRYRTFAEMGSFQPVFEANGENVMIGGSVGSVRMIVSTFDFANSSLGAFVSDFPILFKNMVDYSIPDPLSDRTAAVGSEVTFNFPAGAKDIVYNFDGELMSKLNVADLKHSIEIDKPGKYELVVTYPDSDEDMDTLDEVKRYVVTGHISEKESMIVQRVPTEDIVVPAGNPSNESLEPIEIFPYLIALLILLLIIEWGVYYREQY